jgi:hypothetical protein
MISMKPRYVRGGAIVAAAAAVCLGLAVSADPQPAASPDPSMPKLADVGAGAAAPALPPTAQDAPLRTLMSNAITKHMQLGVVHGSPNGQKPDAAALAHQAQSDTADIAALFGQSQAQKEQAALARSVKFQTDTDFHVLGGGVNDLQIVNETITDTTATIDATGDEWSKFESMNPDGSWIVSEPHGVTNYHFVLTHRAGNAWIVDSYEDHYAPGHTP